MKMVRAVLTIVFFMVMGIPFALTEEAPKPPQATVDLEGKLLFTIQAGTKAFTPELRAAQIAARIKELAKAHAMRIQRAIEAYREERSISNIVIGLGLTLRSTVILIALTYLLNCSVRKTRQAIHETSRIRSVRFGTFEFFYEGGVEILSLHYAQLRDGNATTIPESYRPDDYAVPTLRIVDTSVAERFGKAQKEGEKS